MEKDYPFLCEYVKNRKLLKKGEELKQQEIQKLKHNIKKISEDERRERYALIHELQHEIHIMREFAFYLKRQKVIDQENKVETKLATQQNKIGQSLYRRYKEGKTATFTYNNYYQLVDYLIAIENYTYLEQIIAELKVKCLEASYEQEEAYLFIHRVKLLLARIKNKEVKEKTIPIRREFMEFKEQRLIRQKEDTTHDYLFDIIAFLIKEPNGDNFIQKLFQIQKEFKRDIVNIKSDNEHILIYLLKLLSDSCFLKLQNQTSDYVPIEQLVSIINLYISQNIKMTDDEKKECRQIHDELIADIQTSHYKEKSEVLTVLTQIESKSQLHDRPTIKLNPYYNQGNIDKTYTISLNNNKEAYSVFMQGNQITFKFHTLDVALLLGEDNEIDTYFKNTIFNHHNQILKDFLPNDIYFNKDECRPSVTYEFTVDSKGKITNFKVYECMVKLDDIIEPNKFTLENIKDDHNLWEYTYFYYFMKGDHQNLIDVVTKDSYQYVANRISNYFVGSGLPCIYRVYQKMDGNTYEYYMRNLAYLFGKIDAEEAVLMHRVLLESNNYAYYSNSDIGHDDMDKTLIPLNPLTSYPGLVMQRLIKEYLIRDKNMLNRSGTDDEWQVVVDDTIERANKCQKEKRFGLR